MKKTFAQDILSGLSDYPKHLSSKYFYDAAGDKIFQQIMNMPEYYLTKSEYEIFQNDKELILKHINPDKRKFQLIELGAGDGYKTKVLLEYFLKQKSDFEYIPIDISANVLTLLKNDLHNSFHELKVESLQGDYFHMLEKIGKNSHLRKLVMFLGSNIGNFSFDSAISFLKQVSKQLSKEDYFLIGIDLKKNPAVILSAYNDPAGITASFNKNLLIRINRELGADFVLDNFMHYPVYDPQTGECRSYLLSLKDQIVNIADLEQNFIFEKYESIHTEISRKYSLKEINILAEKSGFKVVKNFTDSNKYYVDSLWQKV